MFLQLSAVIINDGVRERVMDNRWSAASTEVAELPTIQTISRGTQIDEREGGDLLDKITMGEYI